MTTTLPADTIQTISPAAAGTLLGVNANKVPLLIQTGLLKADARGNPVHDDVERLAAIERTYRPCGAAGFKTSTDTALFVPTSNPAVGLSMIFSDEDDRRQALAGLDRPLQKGEDITGWWRVSVKNADLLVNRRALIYAITGGRVSQVARVVARAATQAHTKRKAFVVELLSDDIRDSLQGRLEKPINQTGRYYSTN